MKNFQPIKLKSAFKDYLWGGVKLKTDFNKETPLDIVAESWELSTHKDGQSVVAQGEFQGLTLQEYVNKFQKEDVLGTNSCRFDYFPILIKLIDAKQNLSVQVHPNDEFALKNENEYGKTEMWYIANCEKGAYLYYGFNKEITKEEFKKRIEDNTLLSVLNKVNVKKGDVFFIKSGTVHAIGAGIVICEIQQNSNTTYRVYDYGRVDKNGVSRPLHIEKAIEVANLDKPQKFQISETKSNVSYEETLLCDCEYFNVRKFDIKKSAKISITNSSFHSIIVMEKCCEIIWDNGKLEAKKGDSIFIPACEKEYEIIGESQIILTQISAKI